MKYKSSVPNNNLKKRLISMSILMGFLVICVAIAIPVYYYQYMNMYVICNKCDFVSGNITDNFTVIGSGQKIVTKENPSDNYMEFTSLSSGIKSPAISLRNLPRQIEIKVTFSSLTTPISYSEEAKENQIKITGYSSTDAIVDEAYITLTAIPEKKKVTMEDKMAVYYVITFNEYLSTTVEDKYADSYIGINYIYFSN